MKKYEIIKIRNNPGMLPQAANWFYEKWGIPSEVYEESMRECLSADKEVPQWYVVIKNDRMIAGAGVIENDFHDRKDLTPNICALYVEKEYRCGGIAGKLLDFVCRDMERKGIATLYLITDHTSFYEKYGWEFLCMVQGEEAPARMYRHVYE